MTDELTPEEKEALQSLPRERMPAGLEGRVVDAMRERGFLGTRRRVIELTRGRAAAVFAAAVALMIGAYSIGLHRGGGDEVLLPSSAQMPPNDVPRADAVAPQTDQVPKPEAPTTGESRDAQLQERKPETSNAVRSTTDAVRKDAPQAPEPAQQPEVDAEMPESDGRMEEKRETLTSEAPRAPSGTAFTEWSAKSSFRAQELSAAAAPKQQLIFLWNGTPITVEADSSRISEDQRGRILIIYTRQGIIRIPLEAE